MIFARFVEGVPICSQVLYRMHLSLHSLSLFDLVCSVFIFVYSTGILLVYEFSPILRYIDGYIFDLCQTPKSSFTLYVLPHMVVFIGWSCFLYLHIP